jgi:hypothetical protein
MHNLGLIKFLSLDDSIVWTENSLRQIYEALLSVDLDNLHAILVAELKQMLHILNSFSCDTGSENQGLLVIVFKLFYIGTISVYLYDLDNDELLSLWPLISVKPALKVFILNGVCLLLTNSNRFIIILFIFCFFLSFSRTRFHLRYLSFL